MMLGTIIVLSIIVVLLITCLVMKSTANREEAFQKCYYEAQKERNNNLSDETDDFKQEIETLINKLNEEICKSEKSHDSCPLIDIELLKDCVIYLNYYLKYYQEEGVVDNND